MPKYAKIGYKGLNKQKTKKKNKKKKQRFLETVGIGGMSLVFLFFFVFFWVFLFFFFLFFFFFVLFFQAPREGCRVLSLVICFSSCQSMHMSKQRMCKEECKKRTLTVPCSESGEL